MATGQTTNEMTDDELMQFCYLDPSIELIYQTTNKILMDDDDEYISHRLVDVLEIPEYLLFTKNKIFEQMVQQKIYQSASSINLEQLEQITILLHQLNVLDLEESLWTTYFKAGTGILNIRLSNLKRWPLHVKKMIHLNRRPTTISELHEIKIDDNDCLKFVIEHQHEIKKRRQELQQELISKKQQFSGFTNTIENTLKIFIQEHITFLRLKYECQIKLVDLDYRQQLLDHDVLQQNPTEQNLKLIKCLFNLKYDYEHAKQEVLLHKSSKAIDSAIQISSPSSIQSLTNTDQRQQFTDQHQRILQNYQREMATIFSDIVEIKLQESKKIFDNEMTKMWQDQRKLPMNQRLNSTMLQFIDRYLALATEKIQCIYHYKMQRLNL